MEKISWLVRIQGKCFKLKGRWQKKTHRNRMCKLKWDFVFTIRLNVGRLAMCPKLFQCSHAQMPCSSLPSNGLATLLSMLYTQFLFLAKVLSSKWCMSFQKFSVAKAFFLVDNFIRIRKHSPLKWKFYSLYVNIYYWNVGWILALLYCNVIFWVENSLVPWVIRFKVFSWHETIIVFGFLARK